MERSHTWPHGHFPEYEDMLGVSEAMAAPLHPTHVERAILEGLSSDVLRNVARAISPDPTEATRLVHAIVPKSSLSRRGRLTPAQGEQTERLARLFTYATRVFGNPEDARAFMYRPHPELDGRRPVDACLTELGGRAVENVLDSLAFGLPV
jgi:putative toxin-antitoxin system antitoxin component (TIGR02293 family)